ncbi:MAG: hypothetical protein K2K86_04535 [Muribaculaceae bacterium]|nr:hypothetical protein [Muribaculaceae bacterium]
MANAKSYKLYMHEYTTQPFDLVNNEQYTFHKLYIDGECQIDSFLEAIENSSDKSEKNALARIIGNMSIISDRIKLPKTKFRHIEISERNDVFEFKHDTLRIYVMFQRPDMFVVFGGFKKNQKKDIKNIARRVAEFRK